MKSAEENKSTQFNDFRRSEAESYRWRSFSRPSNSKGISSPGSTSLHWLTLWLSSVPGPWTSEMESALLLWDSATLWGTRGHVSPGYIQQSELKRGFNVVEPSCTVVTAASVVPCHTHRVGVVVRVANHMVHPVWLRRAYGTNGCLLLDSLTSDRKNKRSERRSELYVCSVLTVISLFLLSDIYKDEEPKQPWNSFLSNGKFVR